MTSHLSTVYDWLTWIKNINPKGIDLGLDRIRLVVKKMDVLAFASPVIIVGGTNGKGSTVAALESIYKEAGYKVGTYTSPSFFKLNELIRIQKKDVSDEALIRAFAFVEANRDNIKLTPYEYYTLAALFILKKSHLDVIILEVCLGGRLDAVNIIDADISIVTSIGIDHTEYLGETREQIGFEKAGIFRSKHPAVCGDPKPTNSLINHAKKIQSSFYCQEKNFFFKKYIDHWVWSHQTILYENLPYNHLAVSNMSTALMAITLLQKKIPVPIEAIKKGLKNAKLFGRIQKLGTPIPTIIDVAHNVDSVKYLADFLKNQNHSGKTLAVFSMLSDKNILACMNIIKDFITNWYAAPLTSERAADKKQLSKAFQGANISQFNFFESIPAAYKAASSNANSNDQIIVFGSFHTVSEYYQTCFFYKI